MAGKRVTLAEVARAAGVSSTTASFVLNGRSVAIPAETQQRVFNAAKCFGYRPHAAARALATGRTHRIGIVLNQPESFSAGDTYFVEVLAGVTEGALHHNQNLLLHAAHYREWQSLYADILSGGTDGALLVGRFADDVLTPALLDSGFPSVCLSYHIDHPRCASVDCCNEEGGFLAAQRLLELGHERILLLYPGDGVSWGRERRQGVNRALATRGLPADALCLHTWRETALPAAEWVAGAVEYLRRANPCPTGIVCCDELRASMLVEALRSTGLRVPRDCSLVSFNSTEISRRAHPPLTSVWQPLREIGAAGVDMLMDLIEGRAEGERHRRLPVRLDIRKSCAGPYGERRLVSDCGFAATAAESPGPGDGMGRRPRRDNARNQPFSAVLPASGESSIERR